MPYIGTMNGYLCDINTESNHLKHKVMNTENTIARISEMMSSESFYGNLMDMIADMDLELMEINL